MDTLGSSQIVVLAVLLFLDALITLAYAALVNTRQASLHEQAENGHRRSRQALRLLDAKSRLNITYKLSILLVRVAMFSVFALGILPPEMTSDPVLLAMALVMGSLFAALVLVLGDIVPEGIGSAYANPLALGLLDVLRLLAFLLAPVTFLLLFISRGLARLFGSDQLVDTVTEEEIMTLVSAGTIEDDEKAMIYSVLQLDETWAREVMTPRIDIVAVDINTDLSEAAQTFVKSGFSRIPVYDEHIDNVVGLIYAKDLLNLWQEPRRHHTVRDLVRPAYFVPESKPADQLLREIRHQRIHMAIVVDEYGGTSGLVTMENLLEEIVGDILDEYDANEEAEYLRLGEDHYEIDASMDLDDVNELLDLNLDTEDTDTLGGYIFYTLGRVPEEGETIETEHLSLNVISIDGRRIRKVKVVRKRVESDDEGETAEARSTQAMVQAAERDETETPQDRQTKQDSDPSPTDESL